MDSQTFFNLIAPQLKHPGRMNNLSSRLENAIQNVIYKLNNLSVISHRNKNDKTYNRDFPFFSNMSTSFPSLDFVLFLQVWGRKIEIRVF